MEIIKFDWFGFHLQEPMSLVTNGFIVVFCAFAYLKLKQFDDRAISWMRKFYLFYGIGTFFGIIGHLFFQYFGVVGKFPCWFFGSFANCSASFCVLTFFKEYTENKRIYYFVFGKSILLLILAFIAQKFVFIAVDAVLTYLVFCGIFGYILVKRGFVELRMMVIGVAILFPSIFIFALKINIHKWFNKDDFSHILMLGCILCFYIAMRNWEKRLARQHINE